MTTGYLHKVASSVPSMEAISEFKVVTGGLPAEYGRLSGGVVLVGTKSGTREFHGSAFEFLRNDKLNANTWNSNRWGRPIGVFHDNIFGGSLGGPAPLARRAGEPAAFFFVSYEGLRNSNGSNAQFASVPTAAEREGDFSRSLFNGNTARIFDWTTGRLVDGRIVRDPFPGARIPESRFDPLAAVYTGFYPRPNKEPQAGTSSTSNYIYSSARSYSSERWTGRLDRNWSAVHAHPFHASPLRGQPRSAPVVQPDAGDRQQLVPRHHRHPRARLVARGVHGLHCAGKSCPYGRMVGNHRGPLRR